MPEERQEILYIYIYFFFKYDCRVEIKCQLDATEVFIADLIACSSCLGHHYAHHQELKSIIQWLLPVAFRAVVFKLLVWCGAEGYVSGLQDAAASMELWARNCREFCRKWRLPRHFWVLLHAVNLRHGTDGFTSPPKKGVLRIFSP